MALQPRLWTSVIVVGAVVTLAAQTPKPTFEIASVKRSLSDAGSWSQGFRKGGAFVAVNVSFVRLVAAAYGVDVMRVIGGPDWVRESRFDVNAKAAADDAPNDQLQSMLQSLLADRFKLVMHTQQRETTVYSLVLARSDGRLGPGIERVNDCAAARSKRPTESPAEAASGASGCGPISVIAATASRLLGAPVVNGTGLDGTFAYSLFYSDAVDATALDVPSVPTALVEQLGLKLEPTRGSVDVLVIDSVRPPTEN
jgi:uncharacterized protein (TIGR03435 family)